MNNNATNPAIIVVDNVFIRLSKTPNPRGALWFIHGFGESSLSFRDLFSTDLTAHFDLYAPDFPGFGVSPYQPENSGLEGAATTLTNLITTLTTDQRIYLAGHSLGGLIGTWSVKNLSPRIQGFCNIEGNLTEADAYFTGMACNYDSENRFYEELLQAIYAMAGNDEALHRYYASLHFAHSAALMEWGRLTASYSKNNKPGHEFSALPCPILYYWGAESTPAETQRFITAAAIPNKQFSGTTHWPMIDNPAQCSRDLLDFFLNQC